MVMNTTFQRIRLSFLYHFTQGYNKPDYLYAVKWFIVFLGGGAGSILRYGVSQIVSKTNLNFPWATFSVNILGSLLIGIFVAYYSKVQPEVQLNRLLWVTGFCGGFTTFSTFSLEVIQFAQKNQWTMAGIYALTSLLLCVLATASGFFLFK